MSEVRKEFEKWFKSSDEDGSRRSLLRLSETGCYASPWVHEQYRIFSAGYNAGRKE